MRRFFCFLLAIALLPCAWAIARAFLDVFLMIPAAGAAAVAAEPLAVLGGMAAFLAAWVALPAPVRLYVLGHELTHAAWGLAFGAKVSSLKVGVSGGSVSLSKSNVWITLAPYFFPFWTILVVAAALAARCFVSPLPWPCAWLFAVGFTWCFHVCFTIRSLMQAQPDVQEYGRLFSYVLIWIFNVAGVIAWIACTTEVSWRSVGECMWARASESYLAVASVARAAAGRLSASAFPGAAV
ncbi:MAG: hypothetical protein IJ658_00315 [Kiritimatiellae bacterium]|nr:hypothetical protein [Kiritimatiellia bacterium]